MPRKIDISHKTVFFIAGFLGLLWALYQIREVIILLFVSIIFMSALYPIVDMLRRWKFPKPLAIAVTYILILSILIILISLILIPFAEQTTNLARNLPGKVEQILPEDGPINRKLLQDEATEVSKNAVSFTLVIFNNFIGFISVAVLTFYLLMERDRLDKLIGQLFIGNEEKAATIVSQMEDKLGSWLRGQLALSFIIGLLSYIALTIIGVPYALPLAILTGILEIVPVIGPIISAIPAILIAYLSSPVTALIVLGAYFLIQQLENNFIVPQVMKKAVGLNPIIVILVVAIGGKLLGIAGALLAVPIAVVIQIVIENVVKNTPISSPKAD